MHVIKFNNDYSNYSESLHEIEPVWISLSLISVIIFTVVGNSLVCIAVIRERHLQNTTNYFLTSLAFTDCLVACLVMPLAVTVELIGHFPFDALACNVWLTFDVCCCTSSIWHMSVMSLDRYLTLRYPLKYGRNKRRSLVAYKIITIWLISFAICLPLFILGLVDSSNVYNETTQACFPAHRTFKIYGSFVAFFIPLIIMIVTYTLTMTALQQAHTTKKQRKRRRDRIHAVVNLAAMAIRWKRAVNSVEIPAGMKSSVIPQQDTLTIAENVLKTSQRKRSSSLITTKIPQKSIFRSIQRVNELASPILWHQRKDKQLKDNEQLPSKNVGPGSLHNLRIQTKRSRSCAPLLDVETDRKERRRRSSSAQTLLQIRRDSAKISEELANLSAQLSAPSAKHGSSSKRASLSVPGTSRSDDDDTPTINQLLAEISTHQTLVIPTPFLAAEHKKRGRSHSADIRTPIFQMNDNEIVRVNCHVPDLLITRDSIQNIPNNHPETFNTHPTIDQASQRIKDWIRLAASSTDLNDHFSGTLPSRCVSTVLVTENTPMLKANKQYLSPATNLRRYFPGIEQLYGQTSQPNSTFHPSQQPSQMNDHVASVQNFATLERSSVTSIAAPALKARLFQTRRARKSSSMGSLLLRSSARKHAARVIERISQSSFQMVSLDTDDSSSCTSTLTQHSATVQSAKTSTTHPKSTKLPKKQQKFKDLSKISANNEQKAMRVLLIIFSIFVILWTPFFIINLLSCFMTNIHPTVISTVTWLGYCSSCANPVIYTIFSRAFRRAFLNIITCRKVIRSHRSSHSFRQSYQAIPLSAVRKFSSLSRGKNGLR